MNELPALNRPAFFAGQQLTAADLAEIQRYHQDLLWLHQRYLHDWGLVSGLAVTGRKTATAVVVSPGYAVDSRGRSLVLTTPVTLPVPAVVGSPAGGPMKYQATIAWAEDSDLEPVVRAGACESSGAVLRLERPLVRWQEPRAVRFGLDVVLAAVEVTNCKLARDVDLAPRRSALPERQPYLYAGQTSPASTVWEVWEESEERMLGLEARVDTSEAGFGNLPRYQAHVLGDRTFLDRERAAVLDGHVSLVDVGVAGFLLRMTLPRVDSDLMNPDWLRDRDTIVGRVTEQPWTITWLGVEP